LSKPVARSVDEHSRSPDAARAREPSHLVRDNVDLRHRLQEAEDTLLALRNGEVDAIVVGEDIFTLEGAEAASNRFRSDVLAQMEDAVIAIDADDHVVYVNPAAERQYGLSASQALGLPRGRLYRHEWLEPGDEDDARRCLAEVGHWRGRSRHITVGGASLLVEITWSRLHNGSGDGAGSLQVIRDVSKRAAAEAALSESRARLEFALESARIGEWDIDLATGQATRSLRHDQCFGYEQPVPRWNYQTFMDHVHPDDRQRIDEIFQRTLADRGEMHFDCRVLWPDGSEHWIEAHGSVFDRQSKPGRMLGIVADITQRKRAEVALRDADQRKDEFLATLAHELRNPLAPIRNSMHIMRLSKSPQVHEKAQAVIERQLDQMVHLVDDLLDVSRISQGKIELRKQLIDIAAVVQNAVDTSQPLIEARRHQLVLDLSDQPMLIDADMTRLTQVVSNLLNNAAKYTPDGGRIRISASIDDGVITLTVADNGIGIPPEMLPRVFDMFTQVNRTLDRSQGGLGIGLALVKRLVQMHGGSVEGFSTGENQGAAIVVRLPAASDARSSGRMPLDTATLPADGGGCRVLVIDDNRDSAESLATMLQLVGHDPAVGHDGRQALELAAAWRPRLALLDIGLPDFNGHEVARRLRAHDWGRDMVLVALTGWGQDEDRRRSFEAGFDEHLVKPVNLDQLLRLMERFNLGVRRA
jgi:PAS domain S-box-containing protein